MNLHDSKSKTIALTSIAALALLAMAAVQLVTQQHSAAQTSSSMNMMTTTNTTTGGPGSVLKLSRASLPIDIPMKQGYVNGNPVFYINTDISDQKLADLLTKTTGFKVNFAPLIAQAPSDGVAQFYVFKNGLNGNGTLGFQPTVGNAQPGDANYSPLWKINIVEWKSGVTPTQLKSEKEVLDAKARGDLTITPTNIVANCPFIQWHGGSMVIRTDKSITDDSAYGPGQVLKIDTTNMIVTMVAHRGFGPDGRTIYYVVADSTPADPAMMMGVTFSPTDAKLISSAAVIDLFQFMNGIKGSGPMGFQAGIGGSGPGDANYTPIWKISFNTWKDPSKARILETVADITAMQQAGMITVIPAHGGMHAVNCPFFDASTALQHLSKT